MSPRARRAIGFLLWTALASFLLLEGVLQLAAGLARPDAAEAPTAVDELASAAPPVLLAVGDSWVAGAEADPGEGFVEQLGGQLAERGIDARVINRGRSGANSAHAALTVLDAPEEPTLVVVLVGQNNATNFARVAEIEERLGHPAPPPVPAWERLRTVKLARILWANLRGTQGLPTPVQDPDPPIPPIERDVEGRAVLQAPLLASGPGGDYLHRRLENPVTDSGDPAIDAAWRLLLRSGARQVPEAGDLAQVRAALPQAEGRRAQVLRYALLRVAREAGDWRAVRRQGGALLDAEDPGVLALLGGAEAALLAGDWRRARRLLVTASHRAPGFADVVDLACRFPPTASDVSVQEACEERPWAGAATALDRARAADGALDPEGAGQHRQAWLEVAPWDLDTRADLALSRARVGDLAGADALMGFAGPADALLPAPVRPLPAHWRYWLLRNAELGDEQASLQGVREALGDDADPSLLGAASRVLSEFGRCEELEPVAARWYRLRGDAAGYAAVMSPCLASGTIAARLASLQVAWEPLDDGGGLRALSRAGRQPYQLWERDLDLIVEHTRGRGGEVLLLDYPNPSDDHAALARLIADYGRARGVPTLAARSAFAARFTPAEWAARLGPNGHCNGQGYAVLAELVAEAIATRGLLPPSH